VKKRGRVEANDGGGGMRGEMNREKMATGSPGGGPWDGRLRERGTRRQARARNRTQRKPGIKNEAHELVLPQPWGKEKKRGGKEMGGPEVGKGDPALPGDFAAGNNGSSQG